MVTHGNDQGTNPNSQTFTVSGMSGTIATVSIKLGNWNLGTTTNQGAFPGDFYFELISPGGKAFDFLGEANDTCSSSPSSTFTISFADGQAAIPDGCNANFTFSNNGVYRPFVSADSTTSPACYDPSGSHSGVQCPAPLGSATFSSAFSGSAANGTWTIYSYDALINDNGTGIANLTLTITTNVSESSTTTTLSAGGVNQLFTASPGNATTLAASVTSQSTVSEGTVEFLDNGSAVPGCASISVSNGSATCPYSGSTEGLHVLTAAYTDSAQNPKFANSNSNNSPVDVFIDNHTTVSGSKFCDNGTITLSASGPNTITQPYPQHVFVNGLSGSLATITLTLKNITITGNNSFSGLDLLLVAPDGTSYVPMGEVGSDVAGSVSNLTFSIADSGSAMLPNGSVNGSSNPSANTTYRPADYNPSLSFPNSGSSILDSPPASGYKEPPTQGTASLDATFASENLNNPSNPWSLYVTSNTGSYTATIGGYCLAFTQGTAAASTTTVSASPNPATIPTGSSTMNVTLNAHVTAGNPVTTGTVTFFSNGTQVGSPQNLDNSGNASVQLSNIPEGSYTIGADYSGVQAQFTASQGTASLEVDQATVETVNGNNSYSYCNPATITIPGSTVPLNYPSRVFVTNAPGTLLSLGVTMDDVTFQQHYLEMMLEGPGGPANNLILWANIGSDPGSSLSNETFVLEDGQTRLPSSGNVSAGTYSPAAYSGTSNVIFPSPAPLSNEWNYPQTLGISNFASVFPNGANPNGTYEFFVYHNVADSGSVGAHCVNITVNPPVAAVTKTANGTFTQGDSNDTYTITVTNHGPGSTGGALTLTDTLPAGLSPVSFTETGNTTVGGNGPFTDWSCTGATCTRTTPMPSGETDTLTLTVSVSYQTSTATNAVVNNVSLTGGGISANSTSTAQSTITVKPAPVLSLSNTAVGAFTQGGTGEWDLVVGDTQAGSQTSGLITVSDTLPSGYTLSSSSGSGWSCSGSTTVSCTSSTVASPGNPLPTLKLMVSIPASSPTSVTNTASASGGGASSGTGNVNSVVTVAQVPASVSLTAGNNQTANLNSAFATALQVTVKDAGGTVISGQSVTFAVVAGNSGASATFGASSTVITNMSGVATAPTLTANGTVGAFTVTATAGSATNTFNLSNVDTTPPTVTSFSVLFGSTSYNLVSAARIRAAMENHGHPGGLLQGDCQRGRGQPERRDDERLQRA